MKRGGARRLGSSRATFATILQDGTSIRLTGQDSERGTFSHRHAVLHDEENGNTFTPLHHVPQQQATFDIHNSPLSEAAVVGFEYGYNVENKGNFHMGSSIWRLFEYVPNDV